MEEVHVMTIHCHYEIPKGSLVSDAGNSGLLPFNILGVVPGCEVQVIAAPIFRIYESLKATTKIETI